MMMMMIKIVMIVMMMMEIMMTMMMEMMMMEVMMMEVMMVMVMMMEVMMRMEMRMMTAVLCNSASGSVRITDVQLQGLLMRLGNSSQREQDIGGGGNVPLQSSASLPEHSYSQLALLR